MDAAGAGSSAGGRPCLGCVPAAGAAAAGGRAKSGTGIAAAFIRSATEDLARCVSAPGLAAGGVLPHDALLGVEHSELDPYGGPGALSCGAGAGEGCAGAD